MDHPRTAKHLVHSYVTPRLALAILLVFPSIRSHATAANVIVEDSGIVIAIDSQRNVSRSGDRIGKIQGTKMFLIQNRLAIACLGYCTYRFGPMRSGDKILNLDYDFAAWVLNIEPGLPVNTRFDDFVGVIKSEVSKMIPEQQWALANNGFQQKDPANVFEPFIQYVIAGYQDGIPRLSVIESYIDWNTHLFMGPYQVSLESSSKIAGSRLYTFGVKESSWDYDDRESFAYKQAMTFCAKAFQHLISGRPLSLNEATTVARFLIKIEEKTNPSDVGGNIQVVGISPTGMASDLSKPLPKPRTGKQSKACK